MYTLLLDSLLSLKNNSSISIQINEDVYPKGQLTYENQQCGTYKKNDKMDYLENIFKRFSSMELSNAKKF